MWLHIATTEGSTVIGGTTVISEWIWAEAWYAVGIGTYSRDSA